MKDILLLISAVSLIAIVVIGVHVEIVDGYMRKKKLYEAWRHGFMDGLAHSRNVVKYENIKLHMSGAYGDMLYQNTDSMKEGNND